MGELSTSRPRRWRAPAIWRDYFRFIRHPRLPATMEPFGAAALRELGWLFVLGAVLTGLFFVALTAAQAAGFEVPKDEVPETLLVAMLAVFAAPIIEELIFRSWLRGRRIDLTIALGLVTLFLGFAVLKRLVVPLNGLAVLALFAGWALWSGVEIYRSRSRWSDVPAAYRRIFPVAFWLSSIGFGLTHIFNYAGAIRPILVLMVLPQITLGTFLAFARLRYGMWANIGMHASWNALVFLLIFAFGA